MALPVTITGLSTAVATIGPFKSSGGNFYLFGKDDTATNQVRAYKATDPSDSWSDIAGNSFANAISAIAGYQDGDTIHIGLAERVSATSVTIEYGTFDMSSDTFVLEETIASGLNTQNSSGGEKQTVSIVFRASDSQPIVLFNGARVASMGNSYAQIYYSRRTGTNTWSAATQVSAGGQVDFTNPEAVLGASNSTHFIYGNAAGASVIQRTLNSSNVLQTVSSGVTTGIGDNIIPQAVSYDSSGTQKIVSGADGGNADTIRFDSGNTPSLSTTAVESGAGIPRIFVDTGDSNKVWALYRLNSDSDLYVENSTDNGSTWTGKTSAFTATVTGNQQDLSIDGNIYQRGNDVVIPYVVNDNGTLKYNEYIVRTIVSDTLFAQSIM